MTALEYNLYIEDLDERSYETAEALRGVDTPYHKRVRGWMADWIRSRLKPGAGGPARHSGTFHKTLGEPCTVYWVAIPVEDPSEPFFYVEFIRRLGSGPLTRSEVFAILDQKAAHLLPTFGRTEFKTGDFSTWQVTVGPEVQVDRFRPFCAPPPCEWTQPTGPRPFQGQPRFPGRGIAGDGLD